MAGVAPLPMVAAVSAEERSRFHSRRRGGEIRDLLTCRESLDSRQGHGGAPKAQKQLDFLCDKPCRNESSCGNLRVGVFRHLPCPPVPTIRAAAFLLCLLMLQKSTVR